SHARADLPGTHPAPQRLLGGAGLRADPAAGPGSGRGHLPPGHLPARDRPGTVGRGLRAALPAAHRRPLRREPQPAAALLPVPGGDEAEPGRHPGAVPGLAGGAGDRSEGARLALRRGQLGIADARRLGPRLGSLAQRHGSDPVHLLPAGRRNGMQAGDGRDHLWPRAAVHVPAERGRRVRPGLDPRPRRRAGALPRRLPPERGRAERLQLRARQRRGAAAPVRRMRGRGAEAGGTRPAAARLRAGDEGLALLQPARRAPRDLGDRAPALHPARAQAVAGRGRSVFRPAREARLPGPEARRRGGFGMSDMKPLLLELGTEELPVGALPGLARALFEGVVDGLVKRGIAVDRDDARPLYTPRRLAVLLPGVGVRQPEQHSEVLGPYVNIALDADGQPTRALQGFAAKAGVEWTQLERTSDQKGERFVHRSVTPGAATTALLPDVLAEAIAAMPIPKPMRWGAREHGFARPVHWLVLLHGEDVVEASLFGLAAGRDGRG